jgi:hypothetical protein
VTPCVVWACFIHVIALPYQHIYWQPLAAKILVTDFLKKKSWATKQEPKKLVGQIWAPTKHAFTY